MTAAVAGPLTWNMQRDEKGNRTYKIVHLVITDSSLDGPFIVLRAPGLPQVGEDWNFDNDFDPWASCGATANVQPLIDKEPNYWWTVENTFSTKPGDEDASKCSDQEIQDPLLKPDVISGSFVKYTQEVTRDKDGLEITNSAWEQIRGPQVEFDFNRPTVKITKNLGSLPLSQFSQMIDTVNGDSLWGLPARCVKLSSVEWERKFYGTCNKYYTVTYEFDIDYNTFDKEALDEATKVLWGYWDVSSPTDPQWTVLPGMDENDPRDFIRAVDIEGNPCKMILNGHGIPMQASSDPEDSKIPVQFYQESDFLALGIPTSF